MDKNDEIVYIINLLEELRTYFKLTKAEIDKYGKLKKGQYSRMIERFQSFDLESLRDICKFIYNLTITELLNLEGAILNEKDLPLEIQKLIVGRNIVRVQKKLDLTSYLIIIISKDYRVGNTINNKSIRPHLPTALANKAIELGKTSIKNFIEDINKNKNSIRKVYKLISLIPEEMINDAKQKVDPTWLAEFEKSLT